jgi:drug/metabolite transporter (DMT)-like permease
MTAGKQVDGRGVLLVFGSAVAWSFGGAIARFLTVQDSWAVVFWRSVFAASFLLAFMLWQNGRKATVALFLAMGWPGVGVAACFALASTCFVVALAYTTVANVLITMAMGPIFTALLSRFVGGRRLALHTWLAIVVAGLGMVFMFVSQVQVDAGQHLKGIWVALAVPFAGAVQWNVTHYQQAAEQPTDFMPAVWVGAFLSSMYTAPLALPGTASPSDLVWLAGLGFSQLALPCLLAVWAAQVLKSHEVALLALLEVLFGIAWAWLGADEAPTFAVLVGGSLVLGALALNEVASWRVSNE